MHPHQSPQTSNENTQDSTHNKCEPENYIKNSVPHSPLLDKMDNTLRNIKHAGQTLTKEKTNTPNLPNVTNLPTSHTLLNTAPNQQTVNKRSEVLF